MKGAKKKFKPINCIATIFALVMQTKRILSFILLCVFSLYITPKEILHAFVSHQDTEHHATHLKNQLEISATHHHCELMKMDQQFASNEVSIPFYDFQKPSYFEQKQILGFLCSFRFSENQVCNPLRGPPIV